MNRLPLLALLLLLFASPAAADAPGDLLRLAPVSPEPAAFLRPVSAEALGISFVTLDPLPAAFTPSLDLSATPLSPYAMLESCVAFPQSGTSSGKCFPGPVGPGGKFKIAMLRTFSPLSLLTVAAGAAMSQALDSDEGYGQGWSGYGRRLADRMGTRVVKQFTGTFLAASLLRENPQYDASPNAGFGPRLGHAIKRVFVTRTDAGGERFATYNFIGNAAGAGVSQAWLRHGDRGARSFFVRFVTGLAFDALVNMWDEFIICRNADRK